MAAWYSTSMKCLGRTTFGFVLPSGPGDSYLTLKLQQNTLGLLFAELELNFHLFRAVTPFYGEYVVDGSVAHLSPRCKTSNAQAVLACFKFGTKLSTLNVLTCSATTGLTRSDISRQVGFFER